MPNRKLREAIEETTKPAPKPKATPSEQNPDRDLTLKKAADTLKNRRKKQMEDLGL